MNNKEYKNTLRKQEILNDFISMIVKSWTYERLTDKERKIIIHTLIDFIYENKINGNKDNIWASLNNCYHMALNMLDYKPIGWRE